MELEKAIEGLNGLKIILEIDNGANFEATPVTQKEIANEINVVLNHLTKQDKMIELMAAHLEDNLTDDICNKEPCYADEYINGHCQKCLDCIKQYFEKKAGE